MKVLILTPYPPDEAPSQRFRFELFFKHLDKNQVTLESQSFISPQAWKALYAEKKTGSKFRSVINGFLRRAISLFKIRKYDFIFIHRELTPFGPPIFEWIIAKVLNKKIIYDFDDAIWLPDQKQGVYSLEMAEMEIQNCCDLQMELEGFCRKCVFG
ncbi:MAG: hypothetical protein RLQ12_01615 [Cyclobacteriaceae bacterium]